MEISSTTDNTANMALEYTCSICKRVFTITDQKSKNRFYSHRSYESMRLRTKQKRVRPRGQQSRFLTKVISK